jgi:hypothetical protein
LPIVTPGVALSSAASILTVAALATGATVADAALAAIAKAAESALAPVSIQRAAVASLTAFGIRPPAVTAFATCARLDPGAARSPIGRRTGRSSFRSRWRVAREAVVAIGVLLVACLPKVIVSRVAGVPLELAAHGAAVAVGAVSHGRCGSEGCEDSSDEENVFEHRIARGRCL